jgi:PAS domain S-box-containing protein
MKMQADHFRELYEFAPVGIEQVAARGGKLLAVNARLCEILGYTREALLGMTFAQLTHPDDLKAERKLVRRLLSGKVSSYTIEKRYRHRHGGWVWVRVTSVTASGARARTPYRISVVEDIGERRRLHEDQAHLAAIVANSEDAILSKDLHGRILSWNPAAETMFGYRVEEILGKPINLLIPRERLEEEHALVGRVRRGERVAHYQTLRRHRDGRVLLMSLAMSALRDEGGSIIGTASIMRDVTEQNRQLQAMLESEERTRAIVNAAMDAIIMISERGTIDSVNPAGERMFGYPAEEMIGQNVRMLMPPSYRQEHDAFLRRYLETGQARLIGTGRDVMAQRKDRSTFPVSLTVSELRLGQRRMFAGIIHDLSERKALERQVVEASSSEQRRIGQDLHDGLCQELVGLSMGLALLARKLTRKSAAEDGAAVEKFADSLAGMATEARRLAHGLNPVDLDAGGLAEALERLAQRVGESTGIACAFEWDGRGTASDAATATHLYRIAQEAVANAVKHAKPAQIKLRLAEEEGCLRLEIADDGTGIVASSSRPVSMGAAADGGGIGMRTMNFRAGLIGAALDVQPGVKGRGTVITCTVRGDKLDASPVRQAGAGAGNGKPTLVALVARPVARRVSVRRRGRFLKVR